MAPSHSRWTRPTLPRRRAPVRVFTARHVVPQTRPTGAHFAPLVPRRDGARQDWRQGRTAPALVDHVGDVFHESVDDGRRPVRSLQCRTQHRGVSRSGFPTPASDDPTQLARVDRFRTEAGWQDALGMAALGFASASLGLQVSPPARDISYLFLKAHLLALLLDTGYCLKSAVVLSR